MKKIIYLLPVALYLLLSPSQIFAADSTDTPVASASAIKEDINKRIKEAIDKNLKNTQEELVPQVNKIVGYAGTISDIKQNVFTLLVDSGSFQVTLSSSSAIIKDNKPLKPELLSVKDSAIVIGNISSSDIISAKRIVIYKDSAIKLEKKVILSPIVKIKTNTIVIKIDGKDQEVLLGKKLKLDLKTLTTTNKIFGIVVNNIEPNGPFTLLQAKVL